MAGCEEDGVAEMNVWQIQQLDGGGKHVLKQKIFM